MVQNPVNLLKLVVWLKQENFMVYILYFNEAIKILTKKKLRMYNMVPLLK